MQSEAILKYNNKEYSLPVFTGSEGESAISIKKLRSDSGLVTFDPGFKNTAVCTSKITFLDGEKGQLHYRGYSIDELAKKASFIEVAYLLIFGEFPTSLQIKTFESDILNHAHIDDEILKMLKLFPRETHPMCILGSLTNAMIAFDSYGDQEVCDCEDKSYEIFTKLLGVFPMIVSSILRHQRGEDIEEVNTGLSYTENIIHGLLTENGKSYEYNPLLVETFNKLFILHADHEQNCSSSAVRIVGSSHAPLFTSIASGISALWGPLHGGANQAVIEMLETIKGDKEGTDKYIQKAKDPNDPFRLMGFGHRVYKNFDPRARIIKETASSVLKSLGIKDPVLDVAKELEDRALSDGYFVERKLYPNVDFYSGIIYRALGIPVNMFTVMFALGRLPGWIAQWRELRSNREPIGRPRQVYNGDTLRRID